MTCRDNSLPLDTLSTPKSNITDSRYSDRVLCTPIKYTGPVPITPMPEYDSLETPELHRLAKKYGMKQALGKTRLQTKLKEVYLYNHQLSSPASETSTNETANQTCSKISIDESDVKLNPSLPIDSPKSTISGDGFRSKLMRHSAKAKHRLKTIDLTGDPICEDAQNTYKGGVPKELDHQLVLCTRTDEPLNSNMALNVVENNSVIISDQEIFQCNVTDSITSTISLLDSSTDKFPDHINLNHDDVNVTRKSADETCLKDSVISKECKISSPNISHEVIDLTASDLSDDSVNIEHSISDIFEVQISGTRKELSCDNMDECSHTNVSEENPVHSEQSTSVFNHGENAKIYTDDYDGSSGEDCKIYVEREKFHQSIFGSTDEGCTDDEKSEGECMSLFQRIMSKRKQSCTAKPNLANKMNGLSENSPIVNIEMNPNGDKESSNSKQLTQFSPPKKARKIQKKNVKKPSDSETVSQATNKVKNSKLAKENLELEMCHAIKSNSTLHSQILLYRPIYFSQFKIVMKNYGIQVSSNELRDFLDCKGITFSTADENRHKGPRVAKKRRNAKG